VSQTGRLEAALGHSFGNAELLRQALTHRSHSSPHNERLEFLGDSVLDCAVAALLYQRFADLREGDLSRQRANLVRQEALAQVARSLALGDYLRLGDGELRSGGSSRPSILADALEAVLGATYLDAGFDVAYGVVERLLHPLLIQLDPSDPGKDPKTALQELLQGRKQPLPHYALLTTHGEAHAQEFEIECAIPSLAIRTQGSGTSRRIAEQAAAREALRLLGQS